MFPFKIELTKSSTLGCFFLLFLILEIEEALVVSGGEIPSFSFNALFTIIII